MKDSKVEALLAASRAKDASTNKTFTNTVMDTISSSEIMTSHVRRMNVNKKETFFMKFKHLPKLAIFAIAIGSLVIVSGTSYAAYKLLWEKPEISVTQPEDTANGRKEVSLAFSQCGRNDMPAKYELKRDATIDASQIEAVVKAQCELKAINEWAMATYAQGPNGTFGDARKNETPMVSMARHIQSVDANSVTFAALKGYGYPEETFETSKDVRYVAGGQEVSRSTFQPNDTVVYVSLSKTVQTPKDQCTTDACRTYGEYRGVNRVVAIVKLDKPFQDYDQRAWQSLTEVIPCIGNPSEFCHTGYSGSIDLYMGGQNSAEDFASGKVVTKEIEGVITSINGATFTLKGSSGAIYTVKAPSDIITTFNTQKSANYNNQKVAIGNTLSVRYHEDQASNSKTIAGNSIDYIALKIEMVSKGDTFKAY